MAFKEIRLDPLISMDATGGPAFNTTIVESPSGREQRNAEWPNSRREWNIRFKVLWRGESTNLARFRALVSFFNCRQGSFEGFRFKDFTDYTDWGVGKVQLIGGVYRLVKQYTDGTNTYNHIIRKPVNGTIVLSGVTGTGLVLDTTTGIIANATSTGTWTGEYDVPVRFTIDKMNYKPNAKGHVDWDGVTVIEDMNA